MAKKMKKWAKEHLKGIENCTFPSFTPDLKELDEDGIRWDVNQAIKHGFFSTLVAGETGLTFEESKRLVSIVTDEAKDRLSVCTTLLYDSFEKNMEMLKHAEACGCNTLLLGFPATFYPKTDEEIYKAALEFCDATNIGIILYPSPHYNFQRLHNSGFPLGVLEKLADHDNVVGAKVGEMGLYADCYRRFGDKVFINCPVERFAPLMIKPYKMQWMGAGCYEVMQSPEKPYLVEYFNLLQQGKVDAAMEIYWMLTPARVLFEQQFNATVMSGTYHWTQHKLYQWCVGGNGGPTRQPSMKLHQHEIEATKMGFRMINIEPREPDEEFYMGRMNYKKSKSAQASDTAVDISSVRFSDAEDQDVALSDFKGKTLVMYGGGKGAVEEVKAWGKALTKAFEANSNVVCLEAAFVGKLPVFVPKKAVKKELVKAAKARLLVDWTGDAIERLGVADTNRSHVFVVDENGNQTFKLVADYSKKELDKVKGYIAG